ncbi:sec-independent protein translocase protein TatB [Hoeflea marina]|uniref:Sec-independent protein translocase protein TatB n=1 Tax=Hoeflea marina TaxID=274592 RepID=A0A317PRV6_9HYPH|nr:Sec-independent protein translocase protein TatB [Hoeflea marina]PWW04198.1 sec-independent protein translocase protein TatB [Hoeflea marina]
MFDVGWPELLVIAIVLIVVVGPKDLPPMLRAFGRTTKKLRGMANEFRGQFDEVLREAELDDVKKTLTEARKLNPIQTIRDAVNPLKSTGEQIKSDLEKTINANPTKTTDSEVEAPAVPKVDIPPSSMKLGDGPPTVPAPWTPKSASAPVTADEPAIPAKAGKAPGKAAAKPAAKPASEKAAATSAAKAPAAAPAKAKTAAAKPASVTAPAPAGPTVAAKAAARPAAKAASAPAKPTPARPAAKPAAAKTTTSKAAKTPKDQA